MSEPHSEVQSNSEESVEPADDGSGVGALLQASRLRIGEELREVADVLRIRYRYLEDIEAGRFHALPGTTYAIGFIRTYADHLGLDGEEVVRRFKEEVAASKGDENLEFPSPIGESGIPAGAVVFVGLIIAVLAYGAWYVSTTEKGFFAELISPIPDRLAKILPDDEKAAIEPATKSASMDAPTEQTKTSAADKTLETAVSALSGTTPSDKPEVEKPSLDASENPVVSNEATPAADVNETAMNQPSQTSETAQEANTASESPQQTAMTAPEPASPDSTATPAPIKPKAEDVKKEESAAATTQESEKKIVEIAAAEKKPEETQPAPQKEEKKEEKKPVVLAPQPATETAPTPTPSTPEPETASQPSPQVAATVPSESAAPKGRVYGVENKDARIIVRAKKNSWIQVRDDVANKLLLTRLLRQGDSYRVPNREGLKLLAGNAGALEILVDGKSVPAIGPQGAVRRSVSLDAKRLVEGNAVIE